MGYLVYALLSLGTGVVSVVAGVYLQPLFVMRIVEWFFPRVLWRVPGKRGAGGRKVVALTIDDAPRHGAAEILDLLQEHGCRATWFIIESYGQSLWRPTGSLSLTDVQERRNVVLRMLREGHEVGNHMVEDRPSIRLSAGEFEKRFNQCHDFLDSVHEEHMQTSRVIHDGMQSRPLYFRPASGYFSTEMLNVVERKGYRTVLGSCYPHDPQLPFAWLNYWRIRLMVREGDVIIIHDRKWTAPMLRMLLPWMASAGFQCTTVSEATQLR